MNTLQSMCHKFNERNLFVLTQNVCGNATADDDDEVMLNVLGCQLTY